MVVLRGHQGPRDTEPADDVVRVHRHDTREQARAAAAVDVRFASGPRVDERSEAASRAASGCSSEMSHHPNFN